MNISRRVLHRITPPRGIHGLETWIDSSGFRWFGNDRHSMAYLYLNRKQLMYAYCTRKRTWEYVNFVSSSWGVMP